jgi:hypothetical protein
MTTPRPTFGRLDSSPDRRAEARRPVALRGKLVVGPAFVFDCVIRNLSDGGARIELALAVTAPNEVWLVDLSSAIAWRAAVIWRRPPETGLKFLERHDLKRPTAATPGHLRKLWLDASGR